MLKLPSDGRNNGKNGQFMVVLVNEEFHMGEI